MKWINRDNTDKLRQNRKLREMLRKMWSKMLRG